MTTDLEPAIRAEDCASCGEEMPEGECPKSERPCGHHDNHIWTHDECFWCGKEFGEGRVTDRLEEARLRDEMRRSMDALIAEYLERAEKAERERDDLRAEKAELEKLVGRAMSGREDWEPQNVMQMMHYAKINGTRALAAEKREADLRADMLALAEEYAHVAYTSRDVWLSGFLEHNVVKRLREKAGEK